MNEDLKHYTERFEALLTDLGAINDDIAELAKEAKERGLDPKVVKKIAQVRIDDKKRLALENGTRTLLDYMDDLGDPLFRDDAEGKLAGAVDRLGGAENVIVNSAITDPDGFVATAGDFLRDIRKKTVN